MTVIQRTRSAGALLLLALLSACSSREKAPVGNAPVILISIDTLRSDHLPVYGYGGVATPAIDALRRDSILFDRAYSPCPMTLPSHLSIFTGLDPNEHGVRNNLGYRFDRTRFSTLAEELRKRGYRTGAAVSSYVLRSETGIDDGFDFFEDSIPVVSAGSMSEHQRAGDATLAYALPWIERHAAQPFFFFFHIYEPHAPYHPSYDGEIATSDAIVGKLLDRLKSLQIYDQAIVVLLSDHGEGLWEHGEDQHGILLYRESLQVPLIIKLPQSARAGSSVGTPVSISRVFDTILDRPNSLLGIQRPEPIYAETLYPRIHLGWSDLRSLIEGQFHYIEAPNAELYDLERDPAEKSNLIASERRVAAAMRRRLELVPAGAAAVEVVDAEEASKLAALGYIGTPRQRSGPLPNPVDEIEHLDDIRRAFQAADQRRYEEAVPLLRGMLEKNPRLTDVGTRLGEALVEMGNPREAIKVYKDLIARRERFSPDLALYLAAAYLKAEQVDDAIAHAEIAVKTNPREAHEMLAQAAIEQQRFGDAENHIRIALEEGGQQPRTLLLLAEMKRAAGRLEEALQAADQAEQRSRQLGVMHLYGLDHLRGDVLARLDRPEEAITAYRRGIEAAPHHLQSYANLAVIHMIRGEPQQAHQILESMARVNPHRGAYLLAARTLEAFEDRKGAARWRTRAARGTS